MLSFVTARDGNMEVYTMNADGSDPTNITNHPADDFVSTWMSDGSRLVFDTNRDGNWEIYSILLNGTGATRLTNNPADDEFPVWRP
jgi:Tol biopolymer transport system component